MEETPRKDILIIDDNPFILESIKKQLKDLCLNIMTISNPVEGLELVEKNHYNLVLCDIKMSPINGIDVLISIKSKHPELPVIILSGHVDDQLIEKTKKLGCENFLIKPIRKEELVLSINKALNR